MEREISTQVACNAACVQGKRSCKHEGEICVCASNEAWIWVWVCVIINQISSRQLLVCVCYRSTPGRAVNARTRCVCVRAHVRLRVGTSVCVCPASSLSRQQLLVCVCVYMYANTAERLRLHKTVILRLIMKYFVLK